ncbi:hypothetical protein FH972_022009 [Carpinus fangiana]|uniref:Uncharacterized protein n=1 Tax=Carpinus fangiana TaxID=176857 RepID=A0A5N6KRI5_9ROSI|nr:hypothetical protein FH972_022009 [Carpinus fangiana]
MAINCDPFDESLAANHVQKHLARQCSQIRCLQEFITITSFSPYIHPVDMYRFCGSNVATMDAQKSLDWHDQ